MKCVMSLACSSAAQGELVGDIAVIKRCSVWWGGLEYGGGQQSALLTFALCSQTVCKSDSHSQSPQSLPVLHAKRVTESQNRKTTVILKKKKS